MYKPGTNWSYAHTNFVRLGEALSSITGKPVDQLIRERIVEPLGMKGTQSHQTAVIPEPVLHAYTKERGTYEDSTFWDPSWTLAKGSVMITDIYDLATSARAIGAGKLVSEKSHKEQVGSSLVGLGAPTKTCPEGVCVKQTSGFHYGIGTFIVGGWILQNPSFYGWDAMQAYLPEKDLAIAASATLDKEAKVGLNGGEMVLEEIAAVLAPDHPPKPLATNRKARAELGKRYGIVWHGELVPEVRAALWPRAASLIQRSAWKGSSAKSARKVSKIPHLGDVPSVNKLLCCPC